MFMYMAGKWVAAAGESGTVNRDWTNKRRGRFSPSKIPLVLVVRLYVSQSYL